MPGPHVPLERVLPFGDELAEVAGDPRRLIPALVPQVPLQRVSGAVPATALEATERT